MIKIKKKIILKVKKLKLKETFNYMEIIQKKIEYKIKYSKFI